MNICMQNRRSKYIRALITILLLALAVLKVDQAFAAPKALTNGVAMTVDIKHAQAVSTEFYNGERVKVDFGLSGGEIAAGSSYSVSMPMSPSGDEYAFLLKADSSADVTVNGGKVGKAAYNASSGKVEVSFDTAVSQTDEAVFSLGANLAVKEDNIGSASMAFGVKAAGEVSETAVNVTIPATSQGYEANVSFSDTTDISGGAVDINIDWKALSGIHAGDYLEIELSKTQTEAFDVYAYINNINEVLYLNHNGVEYGKITLGRNSDGVCKVMFSFTKDSPDVNISGTATIKGSWVVNFYDKSDNRPKDATIITLVNGDPRETPITLGEPPKNTLSGVDMSKMSTGGKPIIGQGQPVNDGEEFYEFGWTVRVNSKGLPGVSGVSGGETLSSIVLKDEVEGPGHYIDLSSIELVVWTDVIMVNGLSQTTFGTMNDLPIVNDQYPDDTLKVRLVDLLPYIGTDKLETVLYGDGDPNHVTGFTLELGDLPGIAVEMTYKSYLEEGSNAYIPSFRDYFYQSLMTSNGNSDVYKNKMTMTSEEVPEKTQERPVTSNEGSASMTAGNLDLRVKKVDENGDLQAGVKFTLYWSGGSMAVVTDENGYIDIPNIGTGLYRLVETAPLSGYRAVEDISFKVPGTIPSEYEGGYIDLLDTATFSSYGGVSDITSHISLESGKTAGYNEIANYRSGTTNLTVQKADAEKWQLNPSTDLIDGAGFILFYEENGTTYYYNSSSGWNMAIDQAETLMTVNGKFELSGLQNGKRYILEETVVPDGFEESGLGQQVYINIDIKGNVSISQPSTDKIYSYHDVTPLDQDNIITVTNERKPKEEEPDDPEDDPKEPVDPEDPTDDPEIPEDPEETITPSTPEDPESPATTPDVPADPETPATAEIPEAPRVPVVVSVPKATQVTVENTVLPKTGEAKNWLAIAGGVLVAAGLFGLVTRAKRKKQ